MDNQQIANLLNIQRASRENRLVIFVGAGVSMNSSVPSWNQLINRMKAELPNEFSEETDALKIAQIYKDSRGHKEYMDKVKDILLYNKAVPNPLHKSILASNPQPIGFSGILLAKRQNSFYCTYFLHNRNVADTKSPYPIKRLEVIRWFNQKSMVFNQSLS